MKKYLSIIIIAILLVLPSVFAVKNYFDEKNAPPTDKTVIGITLVDGNGKTYEFTKNDTTSEFLKLLSYFMETSKSATPIPALPETVTDTTPFRIILHTAVKDDSYKYYLSTNASLCYMLHPDGSVYKLTEESVKDFLQMKYAESLYSGAVRPVLKFAGEYEVAPFESRWEYRTNATEFITADTSSVITSAVQHFNAINSFSLEFDIVPDFCNVTITSKDGNSLYDGNLDSLGTISVEKRTDVTIEVTADWYEEANRDYKGENKYSFETTLGAPATFFSVKTELKQGDFVALTAKNVIDTTKIVFKCEPEIKGTPVFYSDGEDSVYSHALFAVPLDTAPGDYVITLSYGAATQVLPLKVLDRGTSTSVKNITLSTDVYNASCSEAALKEYDDLVKTLASNPSDKRLFDGSFYCYAPSGYNVPETPFSYSYGYNKPITINGIASTATASTRVCYAADPETEVPAMNIGKVVYAGTTAYSGNTVVVDHGIGLLTWYSGMDSISVKVGDEVKKGDPVGVVGNTGAMETNVTGVQIAMSVGDTFVSYYPLCTAEEDKGDGGILMYGVLDLPITDPAV